MGSEVSLHHDTRPSGLGSADFEVGMICGTHMPEPMLDRNIRPGDGRRAESKLGPIAVKFRHIIVLAKFPGHMIGVPLYSHNDNGIGRKAAHVRAEYMGIRSEGSTDYQNYTPYPPLDVGKISFGLLPSTNVHLMAPVAIRYDYQVQVEGKLTEKSYELMKRIYYEQIKLAIAISTGSTVDEPIRSSTPAERPEKARKISIGGTPCRDLTAASTISKTSYAAMAVA